MQERLRMTEGQLIEFDRATKRFGAVAAVSDFSARVNPGVVTGFLGPNGAGKTTTLRMLLGLERPTSGTATIGGSRYAELRSPARIIGAMLEDPGFRARRTVERHLISAAKSNDIPLSRVGELISFVGLENDADSRIGTLSLGMRQRVSAATALMGDPGVLVLDEPANGLDPEGIRWMRGLIRSLADEGRTVLVSSHVLSEVEQIADEILVIARGELKFAGTMEDLADPRTGPVVVDAEDRTALSHALQDAGYEFEILRSGLTVRGSDAATIGGITARTGIALTTLQQRGPTLEDVFLDLVHDRYVPSSPATDATTAVPVVDAGPVADEDAAVEEAAPPGDEAASRDAETSAPNVDTPSQDAEAFAPDVERAEGETKRAEQAERVEAALAADPSDAASDGRPLPGLADLAAVASVFANPVTDPTTATGTVESAEAQAADDQAADGEAADGQVFDDRAAEADRPDDATRTIDVVSSDDETPYEQR